MAQHRKPYVVLGWVIFILSNLWLGCYSTPSLAQVNWLFFLSINGTRARIADRGDNSWSTIPHRLDNTFFFWRGEGGGRASATPDATPSTRALPLL